MEQSKAKKRIAKEVYTKAILMGVALLLLVAALVFFTSAWYTKMVSTAGINLQAAQWDFTANHTVDSVTVNVYDYASLTKDKAAPGTAGEVPVLLSASQSNTDISYTLTVDRTTMSREFQDRIYFYYMKGDEKVYFDASPANPTNTTKQTMTGTIPKNSAQEVTIYWEWVYEAHSGYTAEQKKAWDEFDTKVGEDPELYIQYMSARITVAGVEVRPVQTTS